MRNIKATLNFQMNYGVLKRITTHQILHGKYFKNNRCITLTPKDVPCVWTKNWKQQDIKDTTS